MASRTVSILAAALTLVMSSATVQAGSAERDSAFFNQLDGRWKGPGEIVAGKYKGTKFVCDFQGASPSSPTGMTLDGDCRVGMFTQKMSAKVTRASGSYKGVFLDGAQGEGLDVIAGSVSPDRAVFTLKRKQLDGAMLARMASDNKLNITVSVNVGSELVPVIGMRLERVDTAKVGAIR